MRIMYAEVSPRPRPSEVTYLPRAELREYDYFAIIKLEINCRRVLVPVFIEDLSTEFEFGAKTFIDKAIGFGVPVLFATGRAIESVRKPYMSHSASSSCSIPITLKHDVWDSLKREVRKKAFKSLYLEITAPDFWDEVQEARVTYSPSTALRFLHYPLKGLANLVISNNDKHLSQADEIFWRILRWREEAHISMYTQCDECLDELAMHEPSEEEFLEVRNNEKVIKGNALDELKLLIKDCRDIRLHVVLPDLHSITELIHSLSRRGRDSGKENVGSGEVGVPPEVESLFYPAIEAVLSLDEKEACDDNTSIELYVHHDYPLHELVGELIKALVNEVKSLIEDKLKFSNFKVCYEPYDKRFSQMNERELKNKLRGIECNNCCHLIIVRDANKAFLKCLIKRALKSHAKRVGFVYMPTEVRVNVETLYSSIANHHGIKTVNDGMPTRGILLTLYNGCEFINNYLLATVLKQEKDIYKYICNAESDANELKTIIEALLKSSRMCPLVLKG